MSKEYTHNILNNINAGFYNRKKLCISSYFQFVNFIEYSIQKYINENKRHLIHEINRVSIYVVGIPLYKDFIYKNIILASCKNINHNNGLYGIGNICFLPSQIIIRETLVTSDDNCIKKRIVKKLSFKQTAELLFENISYD